jgi:RNA polymerase sigma factor (sigma-70 family)
MVNMQDNELLREYVRTGSETAFAALVARYVDLVFSTALRHVRDRSLAEDVSQTVFCLLARKAASLRSTQTLAGWLYHTARFKAAKALRTEIRRRAREQRTAEMNHHDPNTNDVWQKLEPLLDEAIATLAEKDRIAILVRYFQRKPMRGVGDALGISEGAAKMRVARSVERLREFFARRGVACSIAGLASLLADRSMQAAPANLSTRLTSAALSTTSGFGLLSVIQILYRLTSSKPIAVVLGGSSAALLVLAAAYGSRWHDSNRAPAMAARRNHLSVTTAIVPAQADSAPAADADLAYAIAQLRTLLHSTNEFLNVQPEEATRVFALFGSQLPVAFDVLKEEASVHNPIRHSVDPAEIPAGRALSAMGTLGKSMPQVSAWLWAQYEAEPGKKSGWAFDVLNSLYAIGFQPQDIRRLAEVLSRVDMPNESEAAPEIQLSEIPGSWLLAPEGGEWGEAFCKNLVAGWIAELIRKEPAAAEPFVSAVRELLDAPDAGVRFWAACALLPSDGQQDERVVREIFAGLQNADTNRLAEVSQLFQDFGDTARPVVPALVEAARAGEGVAQRFAFRAVGKIAAELRDQIPEVDQVLTKDENDQRFLDKINSGDYTGDDLVDMLNDPEHAVLGATLLGDMGSAATNALPALFEAASRPGRGEEMGKIIEAIRKIDPQAALAPEDIDSIVTHLSDLSDKPGHEKLFRASAGSPLMSLNWCTRTGFQIFATNLASENPDVYTAFVGAVLARAPSWSDMLQTRSP